MSEKSGNNTKPGTPAVADRETSPAGRKGKSSSAAPKKPSTGSATPRGTSQATSRRARPAVEPAVVEESKSEESDDDFLRRLYAEQKEAERVKSLEAAHDTLVATVAELHKQLASNDSKHIDALLHRKREKAESAAHIKQLNERIDELEAQSTQLQADAVSSAAATAASHSASVSELEDRMAVIQAKYSSLHQFKEEKADLELELAKYKELLAREKDHHSLNVSELERRNVMEKDRLKNEMLRKIRETKLSLLAMTEDQLHTTTKRTIMENEQMTTELQYQSKETERIVRRNSKLATENSNLQRELELAADTQQQMAKKTMFYQNLITKLQGKMDVMQLEKEKEKQQMTYAMQQLQSQVQLMQQQTGGSSGLLTPGGKFTAHPPYERVGSSLSGILRGVDEMNALASAAASVTVSTSAGLPTGLPLLPRSGSQQSRKPESRSSYTGSVNGGGGSSSEDAATIARLTDKVSAAERERASVVDQLRQVQSQLREEQHAKHAALDVAARLDAELTSLKASIARQRLVHLQTHALSAHAMTFIISCLEDQRMTLSKRREQDESAAAEVEKATLHSVTTDGTETTVVVRAAGQKALQGASALLEQTKADLASAPASELNAAPKQPVIGTWNPSQGYPSSLASFGPDERLQILEHLFEQMSAFQRTNPQEMELGTASNTAVATNADANRRTSNQDRERSGGPLSSATSPSSSAGPLSARAASLSHRTTPSPVETSDHRQ